MSTVTRPAAFAGLLVAALVGGCSASSRPASVALSVPPPPWPTGGVTPSDLEPHQGDLANAGPAEPWRSLVLPRLQWAMSMPEPARMDRMQPARAITLHHDGMEPLFATDPRSVAARLELVRQMHRGKGWGDIGYHFAIDRAGRVWEARPLNWQGAHVKDHNEGNIGILVLGNFEEQAPSEAQIQALRRFLLMLMQYYGIQAQDVHTHREWPGASTACPGAQLQPVVERMRRELR